MAADSSVKDSVSSIGTIKHSITAGYSIAGCHSNAQIFIVAESLILLLLILSSFNDTLLSFGLLD